MDEWVCLKCGAEIEYDWAPCPNCGWKTPEPWEDGGEDETPSLSGKAFLSKPNPWIGLTAWILLAAALLGLLFYLTRLPR